MIYFYRKIRSFYNKKKTTKLFIYVWDRFLLEKSNCTRTLSINKSFRWKIEAKKKKKKYVIDFWKPKINVKIIIESNKFKAVTWNICTFWR
jgi:hypothetical protein